MNGSASSRNGGNKTKKTTPQRMSSFSSDGGNSFKGGYVMDDSTHNDLEANMMSSRRSSNAENTPVGEGYLIRVGLAAPMADVGLDASGKDFARRRQEDCSGVPSKEKKSRQRLMMWVFVLVQCLLLGALLATLQHAAGKKHPSLDPVGGSLRGNEEPEIVDGSGYGGTDADFAAPTVQGEEDADEENETEDDDEDLQAIFSEEEGAIAEAEKIALEKAANAETEGQREAFQEEAEVLEELKDAEEEEASIWSDLVNESLDSEEEQELEEETDILTQQEENLQEQADLLDEEGEMETEEDRQDLEEKVDALQQEDLELELKHIAVLTKKGRAALEDSGRKT